MNLTAISALLDLWAWTRDIDRLTARVYELAAAKPLDRKLLITAVAELKELADAPVGGYRRTRRARRAIWKQAGIIAGRDRGRTGEAAWTSRSRG